jgi:hypothetical protein
MAAVEDVELVGAGGRGRNGPEYRHTGGSGENSEPHASLLQ